MLVVMQAHATDEQVRAVCEKIEKLGYRPHAMPGAQRTAIALPEIRAKWNRARSKKWRACRKLSRFQSLQTGQP